MAKKKADNIKANISTGSKKDREKEEKRRKMWLGVGSFVVAVTMVASGLYLSNYGNNPQLQQENVLDESILSFEPKTTDLTFYVENFSDEFIFITNRYFDWETLKYMKNISVKGVEKIEVGYIKNKYYVFKFKLNTTDDVDKDDTFNEIYDTFRFSLNIEDKNTLLGVYKGYIYGIAKRVKIIAPVSTNSGDFVTGVWYVMKTNTTTEDIGLVSGVIEQCDNMSAIVKNISTVNVEGATDNGNLDKILEKLKMNKSVMKNLNMQNPGIKFNDDNITKILLKNLINNSHSISTDNSTNISTINFAEFKINVKDLKNLNSTDTNSTNTNVKIISFEYNSTKEEMEKILNNIAVKINRTINYTIIPGKITFGMDASIWSKEIYEGIKENFKNLTIEKEGIVSVAESCVYDKKLIPIPKNTDFNAILNLNRKINDTIRVNVNIYSMTGGGETSYIPYIAIDKDLK